MKNRKLRILCIAVLLAAALPVGAEENTQSTTINASVASSYTLTIPKNTTIVFNQTSTELDGVLTVTGNVDTDEKVVVTADPGALHNATHGVDLPYTLKNDEDEVFSMDEWSESELRDGTKEIALFIGITEDDWKAAKAGDYTGTITFTAKLTTETTSLTE